MNDLFRNSICLLITTASSLFAGNYPAPPWHLVDVWYRLEENVEFSSLSIDVEIVGDVAAEVALYIAPFGLGKFNGVSFYGGIQNYDHIIVPSTQERLSIQRIGIFSRWEERDLRFTRIEPDGWNESSDHEDDFIGVRAPYRWKPGKYRFRLSVVDSPQGRKNTWVEMSIQSLENGSTKRIGALAFPGSRLELSRNFCSFIEIFGPEIPESQFPKLTVSFSNFRLNGAAWKTEAITAVYPSDVPQIAYAKGDEQKISVRIGAEAKGRQNAEVQLQK